MGLRQRIGRDLARFLSCDRPGLSDGPTSDIEALIRAIMEHSPTPCGGPSNHSQVTARRRHHTLFTPRDFDISPFFLVVKPALQNGFNPYEIPWVEAISP